MLSAENPFQHWRRIITGLRAEETKLESICFEHAGKAPDAVFGGKGACKGETAFIFGRRSTGSFDVRRLDGTRISAGISFKKLRLLERRRTYLTELRKETALPPLPERRGLRAEF